MIFLAASEDKGIDSMLAYHAIAGLFLVGNVSISMAAGGSESREAAPNVRERAPTAVGAAPTQAGTATIRPRVVISSDFPPTDVVMRGAPADHCSDPDDMQSMVRFLRYTNEFDVEGLIASSGTFANIARKQNMLDVIDLYDQVDENLRKHDPRYPTGDYLRSVTFQGLTGTWGKSVSHNIGAGKDSEASNAMARPIITLMDPVGRAFPSGVPNARRTSPSVRTG